MKAALCFLAVLVLVSDDTLATTHHGECPASSGLAGICMFIPGVNCLHDSECRLDEKCCSEGCGSVCKKTVQNHRGTCPVDLAITTCVVTRDNCLSDSDCHAHQKCCNHGCGKVCKNV